MTKTSVVIVLFQLLWYLLSFRHLDNRYISTHSHKLKLNSMSSVHERTIPTERPPLVGSLCQLLRIESASATDPHGRIYGFRPEPLVFLPSSSSVILTRLSGPRSRPTTSQKIWYPRESNSDHCTCSHELWLVDHRGGPHSPTWINVVISPLIPLLG
jgi:hypothetical protein